MNLHYNRPSFCFFSFLSSDSVQVIRSQIYLRTSSLCVDVVWRGLVYKCSVEYSCLSFCTDLNSFLLLGMPVLCECALASYLVYCRIFCMFQQSAHITYFLTHKLAFSVATLTICFFYHLFLLSFVTSTIWLPREWHHVFVQTPVERDEIVVFEKFCTIFPPHIWHLCNLHIFNKNAA